MRTMARICWVPCGAPGSTSASMSANATYRSSWSMYEYGTSPTNVRLFDLTAHGNVVPSPRTASAIVETLVGSRTVFTRMPDALAEYRANDVPLYVTVATDETS